MFNEMDSVYFETDELVTPRPRTVLYRLQPRELGTGAVEALDGYYYRLAHEHRVAPVDLYKAVLRPWLISRGVVWGHKNTWTSMPAGAFVGVGVLSRLFAQMFSELTGVSSLRYCGLSDLTDVLTRDGLIGSGKRFCPNCILDDGGIGKYYKRLIWTFSVVRACPVHGVRLADHICCAPKSRRIGKLSLRKQLFGVCTYCGSLGYKCDRQALGDATPLENWQASEVSEVVAALPQLRGEISCDTLKAGIELTATSLGDGKPYAGARRAGLTKSTLAGWLNGSSRPNFTLLLNLCSAANMSVLSVLKGKPEQSRFFGAAVAQRVSARARTKNVDRNAQEQGLRQALVAAHPLSVTAISKSIGVSRRTLRQNFPALCSLVHDRYAADQLARFRSRLQKSKEKLRTVLGELVQSKMPLTNRNIQAIFGMPIMPGTRDAAAWIAVLEEKGLADEAGRWRLLSAKP